MGILVKTKIPLYKPLFFNTISPQTNKKGGFWRSQNPPFSKKPIPDTPDTKILTAALILIFQFYSGT